MLKDMLSGCAPRELSGPLATLFDRCSGPQGDAWLRRFKHWLRNEELPQEKKGFPIWVTLEVSGSPVNFVQVQLFDLGFRDIVRDLREIYATAQEYGLDVCPEGSGHVLDKAYTNRDGWKAIYVANEPWMNKPKSTSIKPHLIIHQLRRTCVGQDVLSEEFAESIWHTDERFVFQIR